MDIQVPIFLLILYLFKKRLIQRFNLDLDMPIINDNFSTIKEVNLIKKSEKEYNNELF